MAKSGFVSSPQLRAIGIPSYPALCRAGSLYVRWPTLKRMLEDQYKYKPDGYIEILDYRAENKVVRYLRLSHGKYVSQSLIAPYSLATAKAPHWSLQHLMPLHYWHWSDQDGNPLPMPIKFRSQFQRDMDNTKQWKTDPRYNQVFHFWQT